LIVRDVQQHCALNHAYHLSLTMTAIDDVTEEIRVIKYAQAALCRD
jgi:hypothetical protein